MGAHTISGYNKVIHRFDYILLRLMMNFTMASIYIADEQHRK